MCNFFSAGRGFLADAPALALLAAAYVVLLALLGDAGLGRAARPLRQGRRVVLFLVGFVPTLLLEMLLLISFFFPGKGPERKQKWRHIRLR